MKTVSSANYLGVVISFDLDRHEQVRPKKGIECTVFDPHTQEDVHELEQVNRRAARVVNKISFLDKDFRPSNIIICLA